jgi:hypothetical protein
MAHRLQRDLPGTSLYHSHVACGIEAINWEASGRCFEASVSSTDEIHLLNRLDFFAPSHLTPVSRTAVPDRVAAVPTSTRRPTLAMLTKEESTWQKQRQAR